MKNFKKNYNELSKDKVVFMKQYESASVDGLNNYIVHQILIQQIMPEEYSGSVWEDPMFWYIKLRKKPIFRPNFTFLCITS